ncbi:MAG: HNH endonuclease [Kofleriaceae bacterium]
MLRDGSVNESTNEVVWTASPTTTDWREVDRALRGIGKRRAVLDAEELVWIRKAKRIRIWRQVACVSLLDYLERRCGYAPRTARDRIRVARALETLPGLTNALATGEQSFSAIRELARVATPEYEHEWLERSEGKTVFEIQELVSGHDKGSRPTNQPKPDLKTRDRAFEEIRPSTEALLRQARQKAQAECGETLSDDGFLALLATAFLGGRSRSKSQLGARAKYQIAVSYCPGCKQGRQEGAGRQFAMDSSELERAECDAQWIGSLDGQVPARAKQDITPKVRRLVWRRDQGRCVMPGCRSAAHLDLHHVVPRAQGGTHKPENLVLLCGSHHDARHRGQIAITGTAPDRLVITRVAITGTAPPMQVITRTNPTNVAHVGQPEARTSSSSPHVAHVSQLDAHGRTKCPHMACTSPPHAHACTSSAHVARASQFHVHAEVPETAHVCQVNALDRAVIQVDARRALTKLGFKAHEASAAVSAAMAHVGHDATLEQLLREALRRCARGNG